MRYFSEDVGTDKPKETLLFLTFQEAWVLMEAVNEYCKKHPRKIKAKKLLKEMDSRFSIY